MSDLVVTTLVGVGCIILMGFVAGFAADVAVVRYALRGATDEQRKEIIEALRETDLVSSAAIDLVSWWTRRGGTL